jgi:flagellar motor switch protein FliN/FliY
MEWDGQLMHGFVIVALERITDFVDEAKLAAVPEPNFAATSIPSSDELPAADAGSIAAMADLETPAVDATSLPDLAEFSQESKVVAPLAEHDAALSRPTTPSNQGTTHPKPQHSAPMTSDRESATPVRVQTASFPDLGSESIAPSSSGDLGMLADVELDVTVELGRRRMPLSDILRLTSGSVVELEKLVGEPLQIFANNRLIAEGEAVVIDDQFGVRITSLASRTTEKKYA